MCVLYIFVYNYKIKKVCDMLPLGGLFLRTKHTPLFPYPRAGL